MYVCMYVCMYVDRVFVEVCDFIYFKELFAWLLSHRFPAHRLNACLVKL